MKLDDLLSSLNLNATQFGNGTALVVYPQWHERFEFYHLEDYKVSASMSAGGLVLIPTEQPEMFAALVS